MGRLEFCRFLDRRLVQHQHMDDLVVHDRGRPVVVAVMALRLDRLRDRGLLHLRHRSHRCRLPHRFPRRQQGVLWHLGQSVAGLQPRRHGLRVVWRAVLDRWALRIPDDQVYMAQLGRSI